VAVRIFVSYRRADAAPWAGRLHDSLAARLGTGHIFQDVVAVRPGEDFTTAIASALSACDAALVVIGPHWLTVTGPDGRRRLDQPGDHVRTEIEEALASSTRVIPVLVGGAVLPTAADLPTSLQPLTRRQCVELRDATWRQDVDALLAGIAAPSDVPHRRWRRIVGGSSVVAVVLIAAVLTVLVLRDDGDGDDGTAAPCPTPDEDRGWEAVPIAPPSPTPLVEGAGHAWSIAPVDAHQRSGTDRRDVVLTLRATNQAGQEHYDDRGFFELVVDGVQHPATCFNVIEGEQPLDPDSTHVTLVGFDVPDDVSTGPLALDVDVGAGPTRLPLRPDGS
jgi:hypothetical protein